MRWPIRISGRSSWTYAVRLYSKKSKKYSDTLYLPKTTFPVLRSEATIKREREIQKLASFTSLYKWQHETLTGSEFILHDGPPYANGEPHVGHALNKIMKDITNRYKVLQEHKVHFRPGWDCHGLPIELKATKDDRSLNALQIRQAARMFAEKTIKMQKSHFQSWGIMADWENCYHTYDKNYQVEQLKAFYTMFEKGLVYQDYLPVYWSPSSRTALAEAELEYNTEHVSKSLYVSFTLSDIPDVIRARLGSEEDVHAIVWTTTPWTLPANEAVCYGPNLNYVFAQCSKTNRIYLIAADLMLDLGKRLNTSWQLMLMVTGEELHGTQYRHPLRKNVHCPLLPGHHVLSDQGTGLVHTAPAHGFDDFLVGLNSHLTVDCWVGETGCYTEEVQPPSLKGVSVLGDGNKAVIELLGERVLHSESFRHSYPYDWRTNKPVIIRASKQWFINTEKIKQRAKQCLDQVHVQPASFKSSLISQLEGRPYWCISRQRVWGVPIPVFYNRDTGAPLIGKPSLDHITSLVDQHGTNCWWTLPPEELLPPHIIEECGGDPTVEYVKGEDILDIWFDSGTSWASVLKDKNSCADLYLEGMDQLRGWFQSSLLTSVAINDASPYKSLIVHGFTVDEKAQKMSKSKGNIIKPYDVINGTKKTPGVGVDVLRWWAAASTKSSATNSEVGPTVLSQMNQQLYKLKRVCRHLLGNLNGFDHNDAVDYEELLPQDKYMLHLLTEFQGNVTSAYDSFRFSRVLQLTESFMNNSVSNFYFTITKDRLYCDEKDSLARTSAQTVFYHIIDSVTRTLAPILPHVAEEIMIHHPCFTNVHPVERSVFRTGWFKSSSQWNNHNVKCLVDAVLDIRGQLYSITQASDPSLYDVTIWCDGQLFTQLQTLQSQSSALSPLTEILQCAQSSVREHEDITTDSLTVEGYVTLSGCKQSYTVNACESTLFKCERCRRNIAESSNSPCERCMNVIGSQWA